jgi:signal transduction histidine kinase
VDITAQKDLQHALQEAREAAEAASQMKSQFLGNVSHELRTPLNAVINFARLIADQIHGPLGAPQYRDYARDITESGTHLLTLIDDLLDLARAEAGRLVVVESIVHPGRLIATVCRVLEPEAKANGVALAHAIWANVGYMRGDPTRMRQVLFNLIANAIKFTRAGGTIRVEASRDATGGLQIQVADTGIGIAAQDLGYVMESFAQVARGSGTLRPGVGLGLPLSRHLIELHGGSLVLQSTPGVGTTAVISIPAGRMIKAA